MLRILFIVGTGIISTASAQRAIALGIRRTLAWFKADPDRSTSITMPTSSGTA